MSGKPRLASRHNSEIPERGGMNRHAHRVTLKRGREKRRFVVEYSDGLTLGAEVFINGDGLPWTVAKVEPTEIILRIPSATATPDPSPTKEPKP
jgi:hypothetical protein